MTPEPRIALEQREVIAQFIYAEARALDERRFDDWLALFADDGCYWVPAQPGATAPLDGLSLFYEFKALLAVRVARFAEPSLHAHAPAVRTHHQVSGIEVDQEDGLYVVRSALIVAESRHDALRWFAGRVHHRLRDESGKLRIVLKRVDLINCDAPHRALVVPF